MAHQANILMEQGADFDVRIQLYNTNGTAYNLTGYTAASQMRLSHDHNTAYTLTAEVLYPPTNGTIRLSALPALTSTIKSSRYVYDVELHTTSGGHVIRLVEGTITVLPEVTKV